MAEEAFLPVHPTKFKDTIVQRASAIKISLDLLTMEIPLDL